MSKDEEVEVLQKIYSELINLPDYVEEIAEQLKNVAAELKKVQQEIRKSR